MRSLFMLLFGTTLLSFAQNSNTSNVHAIGVLFDNDGQALVAGKTIYYAVPYGCLITGWDMTLTSGTASVDVWKTSGNATSLPTSADSITGGNSPAISFGQHVHSTNVSGWHHTVSPYDAFAFYLKYVTNATQASLVLQCQ